MQSKSVLSSVIGLILLSFVVLQVWNSPAEARTKLTKQEVQQTFIDRRWRGPKGHFMFRSNGTYTYTVFDGSLIFNGKYKLKADGSIKGERTTYRFYKKNNGSYIYYHTRSRKFFPAKPL
ncbi:MAG: hypothetical protein AAGF54_17665 [Pseudomonadota bacterium]